MKGLGIFRDLTAGTSSLEFSRYNLIYGFNGSGKSTLSRMFSSFEKGGLSDRLPANCSFSIELSDNSHISVPDNPSGLERNLLVFNEDFIQQNLKWQEGKANPVFFIGADQVEAAQQLASKENFIRELQTKNAAAQKEIETTERILREFKKTKAKQVASRLHLVGRHYEATHLTKDYESWKNEELPSLSDADLATAEDTLRRQAPLAALSTIEFDGQSLLKAYGFITKICSQSLGAVALQEAELFPEMIVWLQAGFVFHEQHELSSCLLCGNDLTEERKSQLKSALDSKIDEFVQKVSNTQERLLSLKERLRKFEQNIPSAASTYPDLQTSFEDYRNSVLEHLRNAEEVMNQLSMLLSEKRGRPATPSDLSALPPLAFVEEIVAHLQTFVSKINELIATHNQRVNNFKQLQSNAEFSIRKHYIAECREDFSTNLKALEEARERHTRITLALEETKTAAENLRQQVRQHGPAATVINQLIASYLGHGELTVHPMEAGYEIRRHGKLIEGTPSEGEKTAIAISYFISIIESDGRKLKDQIIVIDDPVSSLDTKALNYACSLLTYRLANACQLFILTHNQQCMNELKKAWKNKQNPKNGEQPSAKFFFIDTAIPQAGQKRSSTLVKMSPLLREYDSEYHFLFSHVLKFLDKGQAHYDHGYMMPNVLRRVLDIFLAFKCPGSAGLSQKMKEICSTYKKLDPVKLAALERLAQVESHSDNLDDLISFSSMTIEETRDATRALVELMETVDEVHTTALKRICRRALEENAA